MTCSTRILIASGFSVHMFLPLEDKKKKKSKGSRGGGKKGKGGRKRETKEKKEKRLQREQQKLQKDKDREAEKAKKNMFNKGKKAECSHVLGSWGRGSCCYMVWHLHTGWHPADQKNLGCDRFSNTTSCVQWGSGRTWNTNSVRLYLTYTN